MLTPDVVEFLSGLLAETRLSVSHPEFRQLATLAADAKDQLAQMMVRREL